MEKEKHLEVFMGMWQETGVGMELIITIHTSLFKFGYRPRWILGNFELYAYVEKEEKMEKF